MKNFKVVGLLLVFIGLSLTTQAQTSKFKTFLNKAAIDLAGTSWIVGLGGNVIDDDGKPFQNMFDTKKTWNVRPFPTKVSCEKLMLYGWSTEFAFTYNYIKTGKVINGDVRSYSGNYLCFDLAGKYNFNEFFPEVKWLDLYAMHGFGFTHRDANSYSNVATTNLGFGASGWFYGDILGFNIQTMAKFGLDSPFLKTGANYLQHSVSLIFKFGPNGGYSPSDTKAKYKFFKNRKPMN